MKLWKNSIVLSLTVGLVTIGTGTGMAQVPTQIDNDLSVSDLYDTAMSTSPPEDEEIVLLEDNGDEYFITLWGAHSLTPVDEKELCEAILEILQAYDLAEEAGEPYDAAEDQGIDILRYHECRDVRDQGQRKAYGSTQIAAYECHRPYWPGVGPLYYQALTPWSLCVGANGAECDVLVRFGAVVCVNGLFPNK